MTVKELITALQLVDNDILDFEIGVITTIQITKDVRLATRTKVSKVQEHADIDGKILWIKTWTGE